MRCLEKDPNRRYETASSLALDVDRHLNDEPITARPPGRVYRLKKSIRRHRLAYGAALMVMAALSVGLLAAAWQYHEKSGALLRAIDAERPQVTSGEQRGDRDSIDQLELDSEMFEIAAGDTFLLCSDGLYRELDRSDIQACLALDDCQQACDALLAKALARGARDNVSVTVVRALHEEQLTRTQYNPSVSPATGGAAGNGDPTTC